MRVTTLSRARRRAAVTLTAGVLVVGASAAAGPAAAGPGTTPAGQPVSTSATTPASTSTSTSTSASGTPAAPCGAGHRIEQKLASGTTWRMCWAYQAKAGLVLEHVSYQPPGEPRPVQVLTSAKLAQIHVPYDDGSAEYDDLTSFDFGKGLMNLAPGECPGGALRTVRIPDAWDPEEAEVKGLCTTTRARGHAYRMQGDSAHKVYQAQGTDLLVHTVNQVGWYEYITEWRFQDDGTITTAVGATGSLSPGDYDAGDGRGWPLGKGARAKATSHSHNVFWRLNFGLDGSSRSRVEQYDSKVSPPARGQTAPTNRTTRTKITRELAGDARNMRWWRVVSTAGKNKDGHPRSYEIVPGVSQKYPGRGFTRHDVYVTQYDKCEQYASNNPLDCGAGHGRSVDKWVGGQTLTHPVIWVNVGFHHVARDEDQQPMPVHWQGFTLAPRDVTAMNPLTPGALADQNGRTDSTG